MTNPDNTIDPEKVRLALQFRKEIYEFAKNADRKFYGMNENRPHTHDIELFEAATAWLAAVDGMPGPQDHMVQGFSGQLTDITPQKSQDYYYLLVKFKQLLRVK